MNVHGRIDFESLTGDTVPKMGHELPEANDSEYIRKNGDTGHLVERRPVGVDIPQEKLLLVDLLSYEILYVVDGGSVEAYWLAWTYPDVIRPWHNHLEVEVYRPEASLADPGQIIKSVTEKEPQQTINNFEQGWVSDDDVVSAVKYFHRWIYELHSMSIDTLDDTTGEDGQYVTNHLPTEEEYIVIHADTAEQLVPTCFPYFLPIRIDPPTISSCARIRESAAQTRVSVGAGLNAAEEVSEEMQAQMRTEAITEIIDKNIGNVETTFLPGEFGNIVDQYQQAQEWRGLNL